MYEKLERNKITYEESPKSLIWEMTEVVQTLRASKETCTEILEICGKALERKSPRFSDIRSIRKIMSAYHHTLMFEVCRHPDDFKS